MKRNESVKFYCFNSNCKSSILNFDSCITLEVPLYRALTETIYCQECFEELVSKPVLEMKIQLNELMNGGQSYKSMIIDDDPVYHVIFKELVKDSNFSKELSHYRDGYAALNYLFKSENEANIPDLVFLDLNMSKMDAWEFLEEFEKNYEALNKQVNVYIISAGIEDANYNEKLKSYKYVKALINKPFDKKSFHDFSSALKITLSTDLCI